MNLLKQLYTKLTKKNAAHTRAKLLDTTRYVIKSQRLARDKFSTHPTLRESEAQWNENIR